MNGHLCSSLCKAQRRARTFFCDIPIKNTRLESDNKEILGELRLRFVLENGGLVFFEIQRYDGQRKTKELFQVERDNEKQQINVTFVSK